MSIPGIPNNFQVQQGNRQVFLSWNISAGATSYSVQKSTDGVTFSTLASPATNYYLDTAVSVGTLYYYQVASSNGSGTSPYTPNQSIIPAGTAGLSLGQLRLNAQQRADRVNSNFVTMTEWNSYINQAAFELYDLLVTLFEDYYMAPAFQFSVNGTSQFYPVPDGSSTYVNVNNQTAPAFYKLLGVDCGLGAQGNAWVTLKKFQFISRNRYVYPNVTSTFLGVFNLQYRLMGNQIEFIPTPAGNQLMQMWYIPRMTQLLQDTDILDGVSGWTEYVIVRAAKYALDKEESDTTKLDQQLLFLKDRIESSGDKRDAGQPDQISDVKNNSGYGGGWNDSDGPWGGR